MTQSPAPGRSCPIRYRYGPAAIARARERSVNVLYVVGGLYGNLAALDTVERMCMSEADGTLCFSGDFNWFNVDDEGFSEVNRRVLRCDAILGNVEAELDPATPDEGCGCAYPATVAAEVVERSNQIHARLKKTAARHPTTVARILALPMVRRYRIGSCRIGVVHGDAESLAGWRFDADSLRTASEVPWIVAAFADAQVDVFASTHTGLPAMRQFSLGHGRSGWIANNGAAGLPNLRGRLHGLCTRIGRTPSPHPTLIEISTAGIHVGLLPVCFDVARWRTLFLANWPVGSPAWLSYFDRISHGPALQPEQILAEPAE